MEKQKLLKLKEKQEEASKKIDNLKGREESILQQLKDQEGLQNEEETKGEIDRLEKEKQKLQEQYENGTKELGQWLEDQEINLEDK